MHPNYICELLVLTTCNSPIMRLYGMAELSSFHLQSVCVIKIHRRHVKSYFMSKYISRIIIRAAILELFNMPETSAEGEHLFNRRPRATGRFAASPTSLGVIPACAHLLLTQVKQALSRTSRFYGKLKIPRWQLRSLLVEYLST